MPDRILYTLEKRTPIRRHSWGVGKNVGGIVYLHKDYEHLIPNQPMLRNAKKVLKQKHPDFKYNVVKFDERNNRVAFHDSPDFDTADEPVSGSYVTVEGNRTAAGKTNKIWHHKWLWVDDKYSGFDVDKAFDRSRRWLKIPNVNFNHIGDAKIWQEQYVPRIPSR